jgi:arabinogalactan oligomer/maltooligosaccharide transport system substrate-binding protein
MRSNKGVYFFQVMLTAVVAATFLVTCAPPSTPAPVPTATPTPWPTPTFTPTPSPTPTPEPPAVLLWHDLPDEQASQLEEEIARFQAGYEKVRIAPRRYADGPALERTLSEGNRELDIILGNASAVGSMREHQQIQPVDTLFDNAFLQGLALPGIEGITHDGQIWGIPHTLGMQLILFYNSQMIADPPADTDSLVEMASKFTNSEQHGLGMNVLDPLWLIPWLSAYGGWPTDDQGLPTLDTDPMREALTFVRDLALVHEIMPATADYDAGIQAFKTGQTAMWIDGEWALSELSDAEDMQWGVALLPVLADTGLEPACLIAGRYFAVGAHLDGDELEAARLFIEQIVGPESAARWTEAFRTLPSSLVVLNGDLIQKEPFMRMSATQMLAGRSVGLSTGIQTAMEIMGGPLEDVMHNRISPREAVRGMQARADAIASP